MIQRYGAYALRRRIRRWVSVRADAQQGGAGVHVEARLSDIASASRQRGKSLSPRTVLDAGAFLIFIAAVVAAVLFVRRFGVNMIYNDQFTDIRLIKHAQTGTLSFRLLWAQHNENRILFPNLVVLALAYTTHFNIVVEDYLNLVFWFLTTGLIIAAHKRRSPEMSWIWYCPLVVVLLSFTPLSATLFGYRMCWFLTLFVLGGALFLLDRPTLSRWVLTGAIIAAVVGSFSSLEGLFIWPSGLVLLYLRRRTRATMALWVACAAVTGALYFIHYDFARSGGQGSYVSTHPWLVLSFFFSSIGNVVSTNFSDNPGAVDYRILAVGIIVFAIAVWALIRGVRGVRSGDNPGAAIGVALICFGLLFAAFIADGRTQNGLSATGSRYSIFELMIWAGAYLSLLGSPMPWLRQTWSAWVRDRRRWPGTRSDSTGELGASGGPSLTSTQAVTAVALCGLIVLMCIQVVSGDQENLPDTRGWYTGQVAIAKVMVNIDKAPNILVTNELGNYPTSFFRQMTAFAKSERLSLFATSAVALYAKEGLPAVPAPYTNLIKPKYGATLSKLQWLLANASDLYGVSKVNFRLTGGTFHNALIASATATGFGWLAGWDTATVPNGTYQLQCVAYERGKSAESTSITVIVANKPDPGSP